MKVLLSNYAAHVSSIPNNIEMFTGMIPPVIASGDRLDLDYSALMFFDRLVLDQHCYEHVESLNVPPFRNLQSSLKMLKEEGYLELVNFGEIAKKHQAQIRAAALAASKDFETWIPELQRHIQEWKLIRPSMKQVLGKYFTEWDEVCIGISCLINERTGKLDTQESDKVEKLIFSRKLRRSEAEREIISRVLLPSLEMVHLNLFVANDLNCRNLFDWQTLDGFYKKKFDYHLLRNFDEENLEIRAMREFFNVAFHPFTPREASEWIKLLEDPRIKDLRERVKDAAQNSERFDAAFAEKALASRDFAKERLNRIQKIVGWVTLPLELIPFPAVDRVVEGVVMRYAESKLLREHRWLYFSSKREW